MSRAGSHHRILRLYPGWWRRRYAAEMEVLLEDRPPGVRDRIDLVGGALDAHLHPIAPIRWPAVAAGIGGVAWTSGAAYTAGQPAPPDWPGYLLETVPLLAAATAVIGLAAVGASTRLGDADPRGLLAARWIAVLGTIAWTALLVRVALDSWSGPEVAIASTATAVGLVLLGVVLMRGGEWPVSGFLVVAGGCLVIPGVWAAVAYGVAWTMIAATELLEPGPVPPTMRPSA